VSGNILQCGKSDCGDHMHWSWDHLRCDYDEGWEEGDGGKPRQKCKKFVMRDGDGRCAMGCSSGKYEPQMNEEGEIECKRISSDDGSDSDPCDGIAGSHFDSNAGRCVCDDSGYVVEDDRCVPHKTCDDGFTLVGGECVPMPETCAAGTYYDPDKNECVRCEGPLCSISSESDLNSDADDYDIEDDDEGGAVSITGCSLAAGGQRRPTHLVSLILLVLALLAVRCTCIRPEAEPDDGGAA